MNAINDNNDPFEDVFRDRFADFESEPSEILWNNIEPQLPVNPTRRFPYWQTSTVILGLFLGATYFTRHDENGILRDLSESHNGRLPSKGSLPYSPEIDNQRLPYLPESRTDNGRLPSKESLPYQTIEKSNDIETVEKNNIKKSLLFSKPNTTIELSNASLGGESSIWAQTTAKNNISKNPLNPSNLEQSNQEITEKSIFTPAYKNLNGLSNASNTFEAKYVSINRSKIVNERKNILSILEAKPYGILVNHFKMAKLKFVIVPKEEVYFKEKKPLEFYASAMPLLNYYTITPNGNDANFVHNISVNDDGNRVGFYTQAGLIFTLSDRFKLRTGLTFTNTNHSISYRVRTDSLVVQPADNKGVDISFADLNKTYSQSANYLGTKIEVQYVFLRGEALTHYVSVGGEAAYRLNGNHELNGFANFAYGITRQIGDNAYVFIEPTFSYSLNQQSDNNSLLLVKPNKIGFNIGVNFKIK